MAEIEPDLGWLLQPKGTISIIGSERAQYLERDVALFRNQHGSYRYVAFVGDPLYGGTPVAALQVVSRDGKHASIANVFTAPDYRRKGYASMLLARARRDFKTVEHSQHLSGSGAAWKKAVRENPIAKESEGKGEGLICMGRRVELVMHDGPDVKAPVRNGMLHDGSGKDWPRCSLLISPFDQGTKKTDRGKNFFGKQTPVFAGGIDLPQSASLDGWKEVGTVKEIFYDRVGKYEGPFRHEFNKAKNLTQLVLYPFKSKVFSEPVVLFRRGELLRVELAEGCVVDDRGIVAP